MLDRFRDLLGDRHESLCVFLRDGGASVAAPITLMHNAVSTLREVVKFLDSCPLGHAPFVVHLSGPVIDTDQVESFANLVRGSACDFGCGGRGFSLTVLVFVAIAGDRPPVVAVQRE